jgi:hypothetical protein
MIDGDDDSLVAKIVGWTHSLTHSFIHSFHRTPEEERLIGIRNRVPIGFRRNNSLVASTIGMNSYCFIRSGTNNLRENLILLF